MIEYNITNEENVMNPEKLLDLFNVHSMVELKNIVNKGLNSKKYYQEDNEIISPKDINKDDLLEFLIRVNITNKEYLVIKMLYGGFNGKKYSIEETCTSLNISKRELMIIYKKVIDFYMNSLKLKEDFCISYS